MNIWLLQASEPMPVVNKDERLLRTGMLAEELSKRNHRVTWFSNSFDHFRKKQLSDKDEIIKVKENYDIYMFHAPGYKKNISISRIINHKLVALKFKKISKKLEKPDLIYASFPIIDYAEEAVKYGKKNNVPVIVDIRDLWPDIFNHNLSKKMRILAWPYIKLMDYKTKKIMKNAFAINGTSAKIIDWGLDKAKRTKNSFDKYFYIGYNRQGNFNLEYKKEKIIDESKFNISFFATINNQFDYDRIVELAKKIYNKDKKIMFNICGDGPQFKDLEEKTKGIPNIRLLGWLGKVDINYVLSNSKLGLAPYKNTFDFQMSVSNKFAEYISYGLPIIMTSEGYMKDLLEEEMCGLASQNVEDLYSFILDIKNNEDKYKIMSNNAIKLYEDKFIAEKIYKELVNYLEEIGGIKK